MKMNAENGIKLWEKSLFKNIKLEYQKVRELEVHKHIVYKDVALDTLGNIFVLSGYYSKNKSRDVYVLNSEGVELAEFTLPEPSHCLYIDHENNLYSRAGRGTILKKYALEYRY